MVFIGWADLCLEFLELVLLLGSVLINLLLGFCFGVFYSFGSVYKEGWNVRGGGSIRVLVLIGLDVHSRAIKMLVICDAQGKNDLYLSEQSSELLFRPAARVSDLMRSSRQLRSSSHQVGSECPRSFEQTRE